MDRIAGEHDILEQKLELIGRIRVCWHVSKDVIRAFLGQPRTSKALNTEILVSMISCLHLEVAKAVDVLLVAQEAVADATTAVGAVLLADEKCAQLMKDEDELLAREDEH